MLHSSRQRMFVGADTVWPDPLSLVLEYMPPLRNVALVLQQQTMGRRAQNADTSILPMQSYVRADQTDGQSTSTVALDPSSPMNAAVYTWPLSQRSCQFGTATSVLNSSSSPGSRYDGGFSNK